MKEKFLKGGIYLLNYEENEPDYAVILDVINTTFNGKPAIDYQIYTFFATDNTNIKLQETLECDIKQNNLDINEYHTLKEIALEFNIFGYVGQCKEKIYEKVKDYFYQEYAEFMNFN